MAKKFAFDPDNELSYPLYHATPTNNVSKIMKQGLMPSSADGKIHFADRPGYAQEHATGMHKPDKISTFRVRMPKGAVVEGEAGLHWTGKPVPPQRLELYRKSNVEYTNEGGFNTRYKFTKDK